jgi:hypothetical protein
MTDVETGERIKVSTNGGAGPYIIVSPADQQRVEDLLEAHCIPFVPVGDAGTSAGQPALCVLELGTGADVDRVQEVLDSVP